MVNYAFLEPGMVGARNMEYTSYNDITKNTLNSSANYAMSSSFAVGGKKKTAKKDAKKDTKKDAKKDTKKDAKKDAKKTTKKK